MQYLWIIYDHPKDIPDSEYVARLWILPKGEETAIPTTTVLKAETLAGIRDILLYQGINKVMDRHPEDNPCIVETWHDGPGATLAS